MIRALICSALAVMVNGAPSTASVGDAPRHIPLEPYRKGVALRMDVRGKSRLFQLDTAGGVTVISPALAKEIGCEPWGALVGFHMTGTKISASRCDDVHMSHEAIALRAPVLAVMPVGSVDTPIDGLMGLDVFAGKTISIDFARGDLVIETPRSAAKRIREAVPLAAHMAREIGGVALSMFVEVPSSKGPLRMELDSGNGGTILVSRPLLPLLGLRTESDKPQRGSFQIATGVMASGVIFSPDLVIDGNLGMPFLKYWVVTMDLKSGQVWLKRSEVPAPPAMGMPPPVAIQ